MDVSKLYEDYIISISGTLENSLKLDSFRSQIINFIYKLPNNLVIEFYKVLCGRVEFEINRAKEFGEYLLNNLCK